MNFSAFIFRGLQKSGRVDLGPLGVFLLDYNPARWQVSEQDFIPPNAKIIWSPSIHEQADTKSLAAIISDTHDLPFDHCEAYVDDSIKEMSKSLDQGMLEFPNLGSLTKNENGDIKFSQASTLSRALTFAPIYLSKFNDTRENEVISSLWTKILIAFVSALALLLLFLAISSWYKNEEKSVPFTTEQTAQISAVKAINTAPQLNSFTDSSTLRHATDQKIIITGTFCNPKNVSRMKNQIQSQGFEVYMEDLSNGCKRLGILLAIQDDAILALEKIKNSIEPDAWILEH